MVMSTSVSTSFGETIQDAGETVTLQLEQMPWPTEAGGIKSMSEIAAENGWEFIQIQSGGRVISTDIEKIAQAYFAQCGKDADGGFVATIWVYKSSQDLQYNLVASWGDFLGGPTTELADKEGSFSFQLETTVQIGEYVESLTSVEWEGDVYDQDGAVIYPEVPTLVENTLVTPEPVYGVVRAKYKVWRDAWMLQVLPKPDAEENEFQSTVFAFYGDKQVETITVSPPDRIDLCDEAVNVCIGDCDEGEEEEGSKSVKFVVYDYCSGDIIEGATILINGNSVPQTGFLAELGKAYNLSVAAEDYINSELDDLQDNDSFTI